MTPPRLLKKLELSDGGFYRNWSCEELLQKRTVIFGRNGSGKSTLVRHLATAGHPGSLITAETDLEVLVFNTDYVAKHLGSVFTGSGLSSALFVTGELRVELEAEIEVATNRRVRLDQLTSRAERILGARQKAMKRELEIARDHVRALPGESGSMQAPKAEERLRTANPCSDGDDNEDRKTLIRDPPSIPHPVDGIPDDLVDIDITKIGEVLTRDVAADASSALSGLTTEERRWVEEGAELHEHRDTCLLCENALVPPRSELLVALRTKELLLLRSDLDTLSGSLRQRTDIIQALIADLSAKLGRIGASAIALKDGVIEELRAAESYLVALSALVDNKSSQPHERVEMPGEDPPTAPSFDQLRGIIDAQNERWNQERIDLDAQKGLASARCLGRLHAKHLPQIDTARASVESAQKRIGSLKAERDRLDESIQTIQVQRRRAADPGPLAKQLTRNLRSYLGHHEISVRVETEGESTGFALYRHNGQRASGLSEGERTAISLLHFITSLQESERLSRLGETCVVLDDPVSSLDGESIRNAFHFILNALADPNGNDRVGQYVIFTHNEAFFGLWRDKLAKKQEQLGELNALLRLDARQSDTTGERQPTLEAFPPGAVRYRSEYYRLFDQVASAVEQPSNFIDQGVANVTRRLMESFARWKGPNATDLRNSFERLVRQVSPEGHDERFGSVLQFLQSGSHFEEIDIGTEAESVSNYRDDVVACLALMRAADPAHFEGMFHAVRANGVGVDVRQQFARVCGVLDSTSPLGDAETSVAAK